MERSESDQLALPLEPIDRLIAPLERFLHVEAAGGIVLLACTIAALIIANSPLGDAYHDWWHMEVGVQIGAFELRNSLEHWVNDGLMTLFFFVVGLEVKRELVLGDLRDPRAAALPIAAAIGGMIGPAVMYLALLGNAPAARGWGVPMATDIAFVVGEAHSHLVLELSMGGQAGRRPLVIARIALCVAAHTRVTIQFGGAPLPQDWYGTFDAVCDGRLDPLPCVGKITGLDEMPHAREKMRRAEGPPRIVVHPHR